VEKYFEAESFRLYHEKAFANNNECDVAFIESQTLDAIILSSLVSHPSIERGSSRCKLMGAGTNRNSDKFFASPMLMAAQA